MIIAILFDSVPGENGSQHQREAVQNCGHQVPYSTGAGELRFAGIPARLNLHKHRFIQG